MKKYIILFLLVWQFSQTWGQWMSNGTTISPNGENTTKNVGIGFPTTMLTVPAKLTIKGSGNTSASHAFRVQNSVGATLLNVRNDTMVSIGTHMPTIYYPFQDVRLYTKGGAVFTGNIYGQRTINKPTLSIAANTGYWDGAQIDLNTDNTPIGLYGYSAGNLQLWSCKTPNNTNAAQGYGGIGLGNVQYAAGGVGSWNTTMWVCNNGNVGIGTMNPTYKFHVFNGTTHGTYTTSGWAHSSDKRLKTSIQAISNPMDIVNNLDGVWYEWKNNKEAGRQVGFLAQDVQKVLPEVVVGVEGDIEKGETLGMAYQNIVPILVEALKEQQKMIESLQKEVELLKSQK